MSRVLSIAVLAAGLGASLLHASQNLTLLRAAGGTFALLAAAAAATARLTPRGDGAPRLRLTTAFILAAILLLPPPGGTIVVLVAAAAAGGRGLAGFASGGLRATAANVAACALAESLQATFTRDSDRADLRAFVEIAFLFAVLRGTAAALTWVLDTLAGDAPSRPAGASLRQLARDLINVPLAWLLVAQVEMGPPLALAALSVVIALGGYGLRALDAALREVQAANDALAARVTELATLHSIGREVLSSLDPDRVYGIVERECRKIFDVDFFFLALVDRDTNEIRVIHRAERGGERRESYLPAGEGFAAWVMTNKRGLVVHDLENQDAAVPFRPKVVEPGIRAVLAVPLIVEDRAVGVLSLQSRRPGAYDDHALSVLTTIAQQAAVALENARHYEMATVDSLTGLYLRDYFFRRLEEEYSRAVRYGGPFVILMVDLDDFKTINDRHGHLAGDRYLRGFGMALRTRLRGTDLACRYGGDEFCLLLPATDMRAARPIAERLRAAIAGLAIDVGGTVVRSTASIGLAGFPEHDTGTLKALVLRSDQALYRAKRDGRDRVVSFAA